MKIQNVAGGLIVERVSISKSLKISPFDGIVVYLKIVSDALFFAWCDEGEKVWHCGAI